MAVQTHRSDIDSCMMFTKSAAIAEFGDDSNGGSSPAFPARVAGMTSRASANAWKQYASIPLSELPYELIILEA
jgi:hypothetical protein